MLNVCQAGNELLCAGYTLYSSSTILVLTVGACVRLCSVSYLDCAALRHYCCCAEAMLLLPSCMLAPADDPPSTRFTSNPPTQPQPTPPCLTTSSCHLDPPLAGKGVYGFTLDPLIGEFVLSHPDIKIPEKGEAAEGLGCSAEGIT